jgi:hypothetical protein
MQRMSATMRETLLEHSRAAGVLADAGPVTSAIRHELLVEQLAAFARFGFRVLQEEAEQQVKDAIAGPHEKTPTETTGKPAPTPAPASTDGTSTGP